MASVGTDPVSGATIETNQDDYAPGELVRVSGHGWGLGETVHLEMTEDPDTHGDVTQDVQADSTGAFSVPFYDVEEHDLGVTFTLTATGLTSGSSATATFTDGNIKFTTSPASLVASAQYDRFSGNGTCSGSPSSSAQSLAYNTGLGLNANQSIKFNVPTVVGQSYTGYSNPDGLTITPASSPSATVLCVTGFGGGTQTAFVLNYVVANTAPVLSGIGNKFVDEGSALTFAASATDSDTPAQTLTFGLVGAPAGASINSSTGAFSWTPTEDQGPGDYPFTIRVTDNGTPNLSDEETITVHVNEVNGPPVLDPIGDNTIDELTSFTFMATASDLDLPANTLTFSLAGAPAGASISSTGAFNWTPTEDQGPGDYTFAVKVTDNGSPNLSDQETITVHVNEVNVAPVLASIGDRTVNELTTLTFTAAATDADLPANTLTFSLVGAPTGASINSTTGDLDWMPTEAQGPGDYTFTVKVTDNGSPSLADEEVIKVHVNEVNVPPVLTEIGSLSIDEGSLLMFTASATDADIPANTLTYSLDAGAPAGASITTGGVFTWTPADGPATATITVRVTDNGAPAMNDFETITVTVNDVAPTLNSVLGSSTPIPVNTSTNITLDFTDPAHAYDTYTAHVNWDDGAGYVLAGTVTEGGSISKTFSAAGVYTVCAWIDDGDVGGNSAEKCFAYIVVYDPNGGFVTGGGWIISPAGAYAPDLSVTGKATFGFVSKYIKGATVPTGNTEFQFHAAGMNFKSTSYQWLAISGARAQYKGVGTINDGGSYGFLLTAIDGQVSGGGGVDKFRIKIWDLNNGGAIVYDNQMGATEDSDAATMLGGGSIVIQTKK